MSLTIDSLSDSREIGKEVSHPMNLLCLLNGVMNLRELQRKANAKLRTFLRTSSKEWSLYKKNPIRYELLKNLLEQFEMGFDPKWLVTYHLHHPDELEWGYVGSNYGDIWKKVSYKKWIKERRLDEFKLYEDTKKIRNVEMKILYGAKRLNRLDKYDVPPMYYFHEMGKSKTQFHTHHLLTTVPGADNEESLKRLFTDKIRHGCKSISFWRDIDVKPIHDTQGILNYLTKETSLDQLSLDPYSSRVINTETGVIL